MTDTVLTFDWGGVRGEVAALGGMLGPVWFTLPDGPVVHPFAVTPWADDPPEKLNRAAALAEWRQLLST